MPETYDIIVVGAGHAGIEAAMAAAGMGMETLLVTSNIDHIAQMSCNPAVGGLGKSHLVREIVALGGVMGDATDQTAIQFRVLNKKKGPAVQALRVQSDRRQYSLYMRKAVENQERLLLTQDMVQEILADDGRVVGVKLQWGGERLSSAVILSTGTFMNGLIHIGLQNYPAGRIGDFASHRLSDSLKSLNFEVGRLKTGTPARIDGRTINFKKFVRQDGEEDHHWFSFRTKNIERPQRPCWIGYTNKTTHRIIRENLDKSPLYQGRIVGIGPRYCPSIEDKVVRFPDRNKHQLFLEPEGSDIDEYYANGISTSLPYDVQVEYIRSIEGLEKAEILKPGYGIEYDFMPPTQLKPTLETKKIENLYFTGQINGTSGYEEAAAQGLLAGINAALKLQGESSWVPRRDEAYIGVMVDDLVTRGVDEPYRMFTSRAEYRLLLREDNAEERLIRYGRRFGLISENEIKHVQEQLDQLQSEIEFLNALSLNPTENTRRWFTANNENPPDHPLTAKQILRRPGISYRKLLDLIKDHSHMPLPEMLHKRLEIKIKYEGYIQRQKETAEKFRKSEQIRIPAGLDYEEVHGLSFELRQKLKKIRPLSIGQASRIPGITPAALNALMIYLKLAEGRNAAE